MSLNRLNYSTYIDINKFFTSLLPDSSRNPEFKITKIGQLVASVLDEQNYLS